VFHEQKQYDKALAALKESLRIGTMALGRNHCENAITLNKLGNLYYVMGDLKAALRAYREGILVEKAVLDIGNPNICVSYSNCAEIHKQRSEFKTALKCYKKVLRLQRDNNDDKVEIANTLSNIGTFSAGYHRERMIKSPK
jgi:tetratricopeptide (TPR) repeat protein